MSLTYKDRALASQVLGGVNYLWTVLTMEFGSGFMDSQVVLVVKNLPANAGDAGLIPGFGRSPGGGNGNPLQYSCLENPTDRGTWWDTVHRITESDRTEVT